MTTLNSSGSFLIAEALLLFAADTCLLILLVGETNHSSCQTRLMMACALNPRDYLGDYQILIINFGTDGAGARLFLLARNLVRTESSIILFLLSFESTDQNASSK